MPRHPPYALSVLTLIFPSVVKEQNHLESAQAQSANVFFFELPLFRAETLNGGGERDRTDDPLLAKQVLSQLSYTPDGGPNWNRTNHLTLIRGAL